MSVDCTAVQSQKAVTAYFSSEQLLPFGFAGQCSCRLLVLRTCTCMHLFWCIDMCAYNYIYAYVCPYVFLYVYIYECICMFIYYDNVTIYIVFQYLGGPRDSGYF